MTAKEPRPETRGAAVLNRLMASRGYSPGKLSKATDGEVSASSIRAYRSGEYAPRAGTALAVASVFGYDGAELLKAWDFPEAADMLERSLEALGDATFQTHPKFLAGTIISGSSVSGTLEDQVGVTDEVTAKLTHTISYTGPPLSMAGQQTVARLIASLQEYEATHGGEGMGTPSRLAREAAEEARALLSEMGEPPPMEVVDLVKALKASMERLRKESLTKLTFQSGVDISSEEKQTQD